MEQNRHFDALLIRRMIPETWFENKTKIQSIFGAIFHTTWETCFRNPSHYVVQTIIFVAKLCIFFFLKKKPKSNNDET